MAWRQVAVVGCAMLLVAGICLVSLDHAGETSEMLEIRSGGTSQHGKVVKDRMKALQAKSGKGEKKFSLKGKQQLEEVEKQQVMMCAKKITGDDTPRKLPPDVRDKVLECAKNYMPPVNTKHLLEEAAKKVMSAAKTPEEQKDAKDLLAKGDNDKEAQPMTVETKVSGFRNLITPTLILG